MASDPISNASELMQRGETYSGPLRVVLLLPVALVEIRMTWLGSRLIEYLTRSQGDLGLPGPGEQPQKQKLGGLASSLKLGRESHQS